MAQIEIQIDLRLCSTFVIVSNVGTAVERELKKDEVALWDCWVLYGRGSSVILQRPIETVKFGGICHFLFCFLFVGEIKANIMKITLPSSHLLLIL